MIVFITPMDCIYYTDGRGWLSTEYDHARVIIHTAPTIILISVTYVGISAVV